jgi:hypothetical protein
MFPPLFTPQISFYVTAAAAAGGRFLGNEESTAGACLVPAAHFLTLLVLLSAPFVAFYWSHQLHVGQGAHAPMR